MQMYRKVAQRVEDIYESVSVEVWWLGSVMVWTLLDSEATVISDSENDGWNL